MNVRLQSLCMRSRRIARLLSRERSVLLICGAAVLVVFAVSVLVWQLPERAQSWIYWLVGLTPATLTSVLIGLQIRREFKEAVEPRIPRATAGEILILVAQFRGPDSLDPQHFIAARLESDLSLRPALRERARVARYPGSIDGENLAAERASARAVAEECGGILVIWGRHDGYSVTCYYHMTLTEKAPACHDTGELERRATPGEMTDFVLYVQTGLPDAMSYVSLFTVGQVYYLAGCYPEAADLLGAALTAMPEDELRLGFELPLRFSRAVSFHSMGDLERAIAEYGRVVGPQPELALVYNNRGVAHADRGDLERAIADYNRAIELRPDLAQAYNNRGVAYADLGDLERAIADYDRAIELRPDDAETYYNRGVEYSNRGDLELAIADFGCAIALRPTYADAYNDRGVARARRGDLELAIADYSRAIELQPGDAQAYYNRGIAHSDNGDLERAITDFDRAIELRPDDPEARENRGVAYAENGELDLAIADFDEAIGLRSDDADVYRNRGNAYAEKGELSLAVADFDRAIQLRPDYGEAYHNRAQAQARAGHGQDAVDSLATAIALIPSLSRPEIEADAAFSGIRNSPAFHALLVEYRQVPSNSTS